MAINEKIQSDVQKLDIGSAWISLFTLDATTIGGTVYNFVSGTDGGSHVVFDGTTYYALPVEFEGMEATSGDRLPRPTMTVANVSLTFAALLASSNDAVGAKVTRLRTFSKYLDGHAEADVNAFAPLDVFYIEQKLEQNKHYIKWELVTPMDVGNKKLPKEQALQQCRHRYRVYDTVAGDWNNTLTTCPYTGTSYFKRDGSTTTIENDVCAKKLSDCELRYPLDTDQLPFKGFPGIGSMARAYI